MSTFGSDTKLIKEIAWILAQASATKQLDIPGEYIWTYPTKDFRDIRIRHTSIFNSGNSIKDKDIIEFTQTLDVANYLKDPWISNKFEDYFTYWLAQGKYYTLDNLNLFKYNGYSAGSQESFVHFFFTNRDKRFRLFKGEYWWHIDCWEAMKMNWAYIEDDDIRENDVCILSYPFAVNGDKHVQTDWLIEECNKKNVELLLDFIYLPNSKDCVSIDLSAECIKQITFSLSKTFSAAQPAKLAIRLLKEKPHDIMQISNDENISNRLSAGLALALCEKFAVNYIVDKYSSEQEHWCDRLKLQKTKVVHFGMGDVYHNQPNAFSKFNIQHNRFNLGMLFENKELLTKVGLYKD